MADVDVDDLEVLSQREALACRFIAEILIAERRTAASLPPTELDRAVKDLTALMASLANTTGGCISDVQQDALQQAVATE